MGKTHNDEDKAIFEKTQNEVQTNHKRCGGKKGDRKETYFMTANILLKRGNSNVNAQQTLHLTRKDMVPCKRYLVKDIKNSVKCERQTHIKILRKQYKDEQWSKAKYQQIMIRNTSL